MLGIMGPSRSGKDEAASFFVQHFSLRYSGSTSIVISREVAKREGISFREAHDQRHERKQYWYDLGNEMRRDDPAYVAREAMKDSDILVGLRDGEELETIRKENLCELIIWIDRIVPFDPTLKFDSSYCDIVIQNHWTLEDYHRRLMRVGLAMGLAFGG